MFKITILDYLNNKIKEEEERLKKENKQVEEYEKVIEDGKVKMTNKKTKHKKLMDVKRELLKSELYKLHNFNKYSFSSFKAEQPYQLHMLQKAKQFVSEPSGTFLIAGQTGVGKSHICTAMFKDLILKGYKTKYIVWQEELDRIKYLDYGRDGAVKELGEVDVLYIDDFFKASSNDGNVSESDKRVTNNIINMRYTRNLITIISTEYSYNEIAVQHESLAGRLLEMTDTENGNYFILINRKKGRNYRERFAPKGV